MIKDIHAVTSDTDQEEVAKIVAQYNYLALPVVNKQNRFLGIVTIDDIVDINLSKKQHQTFKDIINFYRSDSCIELNPQFFKLVSWYDNEFGYTMQAMRLAKHVAKVKRYTYY